MDVTSVGVLVCTHDASRLPLLRSALASLEHQTRRADEVLVLVDGAAELGAAVRTGLPAGTRVEVLGRNQGVSVARTEGARRLETDLVVFLDDDAVADPTWLDHLVAPLLDPDVIGSSGRSEAAWIGARPRWLPEEFLWTVGCSYAGMPTRPARVRNFYGGCAAVRRRTFLDLGGYDPHLGHGQGRLGGGEEADFCLRATASTGGGFAFQPTAVIHHRVPSERLTWRYFLHRCFDEGRLKARLTVRPGAALQPETRFALGLPVALVRMLLSRGRQPRAAGLVAGSLAVALGLVRGRVEMRRGRP